MHIKAALVAVGTTILAMAIVYRVDALRKFVTNSPA